MMAKCANGRLLLVSDIDHFENELNSRYVPCAALLTAWNMERSSTEFWRDIVIYLLNRGTCYFVCAGDYSEQLHDEIDELIYKYDETHNSDKSTNVITTYHTDDSIEEIANFYLYGTEIHEEGHGCLLAILNEEAPEDRKMKEILLKS